jgi:aconitate hydratase 2/2-methylisocitrate dehydratase
MSIYSDYLREIEERKGQGLHPKPIDGAELLSEIITQIKDIENADRAESLHFFHLQYRAGTTPAAKAVFLKEIIQGIAVVNEITPALHLNYYHT